PGSIYEATHFPSLAVEEDQAGAGSRCFHRLASNERIGKTRRIGHRQHQLAVGFDDVEAFDVQLGESLPRRLRLEHRDSEHTGDESSCPETLLTPNASLEAFDAHLEQADVV